jgi:hypothetical protein
MATLKDVKAGGITEPIRTSEGYQILRVDARTPGGAAPTFNDNRVREAMLMERQPKERETYLQTLRNEAFIKVTESYRAGVDPLLKIQAPAAPRATTKTRRTIRSQRSRKYLVNPVKSWNSCLRLRQDLQDSYRIYMTIESSRIPDELICCF